MTGGYPSSVIFNASLPLSHVSVILTGGLTVVMVVLWLRIFLMCEAVFPSFQMNVLKALSGGLYRLYFFNNRLLNELYN